METLKTFLMFIEAIIAAAIFWVALTLTVALLAGFVIAVYQGIAPDANAVFNVLLIDVGCIVAAIALYMHLFR